MGIIKDAKADAVRKDAVQARDNRRQVFVVQLIYPSMRAGVSGGIDDWSVMIEAIETEGWELDEMITRGDKGAICVFRPAS